MSMGLIEVPTAHRGFDGPARDEAFVETMVVGDGLFAVFPAKPNGFSVDPPEEVDELRAVQRLRRAEGFTFVLGAAVFGWSQSNV